MEHRLVDSTLWNELGLGHLVYANFAFLVIAIAILIAPFQAPSDDIVHWSVIWSPPRYDLESVREILTLKSWPSSPVVPRQTSCETQQLAMALLQLSQCAASLYASEGSLVEFEHANVNWRFQTTLSTPAGGVAFPLLT